MPTDIFPSPPKDKRIKSITAFCRRVDRQLPVLIDQGDQFKLNAELDNQISSMKSFSRKNPVAYRYCELENVGINLWNQCTQLARKDDETIPSPAERRSTLVRARTYAFFVLALAQPSDVEAKPYDALRLRKLAIKTSRWCIAEELLEYATWALQRAHSYDEGSLNLQGLSLEDYKQESQRVEAESSILRIALAWKNKNLEVAHHVYTKTTSLHKESLDSTLAEYLVDILYEIGKDLASQKNFVQSVQWLERAHDITSALNLETLSREAVELRLAISQELIQAYIGLETQDGLQKAENHVNFIESELGDKLLVHLLRLEVFLKSPGETFDLVAYAEVLKRMIRTVDLSDSSCKLILHHIRKLDDKGPTASCSVLDDFLVLKIVPSQHEEWIQRAIVLRTHMTTTRRDSPEAVKSLTGMFDIVRANIQQSLSISASLAMQTLIWKVVESNATAKQWDMVQLWCHAALHPLLAEQCGPQNTSKIIRKLLQCALEKNDIDGATEIFRSMDDSTKKEPATAYIAFKIAVKSGDSDWACQCLEYFGSSVPNHTQYIYACCLEAQKTCDKVSAVAALKQLGQRDNLGSLESVHTPALYRSTVRLQVQLLGEAFRQKTDTQLLVEDICQVFENAVTAIQKDPHDKDGNKQFTIREKSWFSKNAYNLGLDNMGQWEPTQTIRIFESCHAIIASYPNDIDADTVADISLRGMFCDFIIATALIAQARGEDDIEKQLQDYLRMRKYVKQFDVNVEARLGTLSEECTNDLQTKLSTLLVFDLEASVALRAWDDLGTIVLKAGSSGDVTTLQAMADCVLRATSMPGQVQCATLRSIINEIYRQENFDNQKLAKYMRCLLQVTLSAPPEQPLKIMEQTIQIVTASQNTKSRFPPLELEWLITTAFNHAVDLYGSNEDELSQKWIAHAFTLAHYHDDGGVLQRQLQEKATNLKWD